MADEDGQTQQDLTVLTSSDPTTIGSMLRLLERKGLVVRPDRPGGPASQTRSPHLGRRKKCRELFQSAAWIRERLEGTLDKRELQIAMKAFEKIAAAFEAEAECLQGSKKWSPTRQTASTT